MKRGTITVHKGDQSRTINEVFLNAFEKRGWKKGEAPSAPEPTEAKRSRKKQDTDGELDTNQ